MDDSGTPATGEMLVRADVRGALQSGAPVVALESALITHGLPFPDNIQVVPQVEREVTGAGAIPATVAVLRGEIVVGVNEHQLRELAESRESRKLGIRDLTTASIHGQGGGTTVAATMFVAWRNGIQVFSTGGIGGVHRGGQFDVSADLEALARYPVIVVSAGAKAILDLEATLERLETLSVPVIGHCTDDFPAFYSRDSGLGVSARLDSADEIAGYWLRQRRLGLRTGMLVANPIPEEQEIPRHEVDALVENASEGAREHGIRGQALTPFLLRRLVELSNGRALTANKALLFNNARLAAQIAAAISMRQSAEEAIR